MSPPRSKPQLLVGRYVLYDAIASGGMGAVHIGRLVGDGNFSRTVAIKRLHPQFAKEPTFVAMFMDEGRVAGRIRHPNVVPVIDVVSAAGELLLVMEYVRGETLARLLARGKSAEKRIPPEIVVAILCDVLDGLHAAHETLDEQGAPLDIVHRDVSPQNVMVGVDGIARVLDFGVAKAVGRLQETREGELKGKLSYMAPEQFDQQASRASDVYAATVVLWEALVGERLFRGETEAQTVMRVMAGNVAPPSRAAGTPEAFDAIIARGLSPNPADRFPSAQAMSLALAQCAKRAERPVVAAWLDSLASDSLAAQADLVSAVESAPSHPRTGAPGTVPTATKPAFAPDVIVLSKRALSVVAGAVIIALVAVLIEAMMGSMPSASPVASTMPTTRLPAPTETATSVDLVTAGLTTATAPMLVTQSASTTTTTAFLPPTPEPTVSEHVPHGRKGSVLHEASNLSLAGDHAGARALLEPRVFGGHGTAEEVRMLKGLCKAQHDAECISAIEKRYR